MARLPRLVVPGIPHHVTQRGARRQATFFRDEDYADYRQLLATNCRRSDVEIWAYCLMPNHAHIVAVPGHANSLARLFQVTHLKYSRRINERQDWRGHLWQERFHSFGMDERHLMMAVRYIELNPVRAGLCREPAQWPWSSVHAHLGNAKDPLVNPQPMLSRISDWATYLQDDQDPHDLDTLRRHGRTGRPAGSDEFLDTLERLTGRRLRPMKPGPRAEMSKLSPYLPHIC
ncbi:MAG: hypothetical protein AMXMBFR45_09340 [Gammaproteobacteria bacterium]|nr:transposase [Gammaproteobacteria bacterium]MCE7896100.1 transposase [Gammaproteobacteria bacterium PRO8]MDL1881488.1 transposase [Gammaproteobacteria bacterium PRO2]GIK34799.1 MAG: transposase [Gammaproteobacteria bacterium]